LILAFRAYFGYAQVQHIGHLTVSGRIKSEKSLEQYVALAAPCDKVVQEWDLYVLLISNFNA
jgi:hypothetical protein